MQLDSSCRKEDVQLSAKMTELVLQLAILPGKSLEDAYSPYTWATPAATCLHSSMSPAGRGSFQFVTYPFPSKLSAQQKKLFENDHHNYASAGVKRYFDDEGCGWILDRRSPIHYFKRGWEVDLGGSTQAVNYSSMRQDHNQKDEVEIASKTMTELPVSNFGIERLQRAICLPSVGGVKRRRGPSRTMKNAFLLEPGLTPKAMVYIAILTTTLARKGYACPGQRKLITVISSKLFTICPNCSFQNRIIYGSLRIICELIITPRAWHFYSRLE